MPGHWEGDLIVGKNNASAIGTLVERSLGYVMLLDLPDGKALITAIRRDLIDGQDSVACRARKTLTWDQGREFPGTCRFAVVTGQVYFCDPHSPWQRGTNENTNGLLRQCLRARTYRCTATSPGFRTEFNDRPANASNTLHPQN